MTDAPQLDLDAAAMLLTRIENLTARHHELLGKFWNEEKATFGLERPDEAELHVVTSATCALSFLDSPRQKLPAFLDDQKGDFVAWLLQAPWRSEKLFEHNVYTAPLVLSALLGLDPARYGDAKPAAATEYLLEELTRSREGSMRWEGYPPSGYLTYWAARALAKIASVAEPPLKGRAEEAVERATSWGQEEVYRQLAYRDMNDFDRFEPMNLAYALALYDLPHERDGLPANTRFLAAGLQALFDAQLTSGLWQKGLPKFQDPVRGNVYPFAFEALTAVMRVGCRRTNLARSLDVAADLFAPYVAHLTRTLEWAETHEIRGTKATGWRSNWLPPADGPHEPHAWATALVLSFAETLATVVRAMVSAQGLRRFRARDITPPPAEGEKLGEGNWTDIATGPAPVAGTEDIASATQLIFRHLVEPRLTGGGIPAWTAVFYGPPGTAKTTLAKTIARTLRWPFVSIETSDFLEEGADKMGYQARQIFRRLEGLDETVVLIDEVEEFVRNRKKSKDYANRLTTTAMLTLLQGIRDRKRIILILTTNHVDTFDPAVLRPGRFDLILFVAPPSAEQKLESLKARVELSDDVLKSLSAHEDDIARFTYADWELFSEELKLHPPAGADAAAEMLTGWADHLTIANKDWKHWKDRVSWVQVRP